MHKYTQGAHNFLLAFSGVFCYTEKREKERCFSVDRKLYDAYLRVLRQELVPAMGCTEPIAVAYAAAVAKKALGCLPEKVDIVVSGNIIKNVSTAASARRTPGFDTFFSIFSKPESIFTAV